MKEPQTEHVTNLYEFLYHYIALTFTLFKTIKRFYSKSALYNAFCSLQRISESQQGLSQRKHTHNLLNDLLQFNGTNTVKANKFYLLQFATNHSLGLQSPAQILSASCAEARPNLSKFAMDSAREINIAPTLCTTTHNLQPKENTLYNLSNLRSTPLLQTANIKKTTRRMYYVYLSSLNRSFVLSVLLYCLDSINILCSIINCRP